MAPGRVVAIGAANVDVVLRVAHLPVPGETLTAADPVLSWGGKAANVAAAVAAAGGRAALVAAVGSDAAADGARAVLASAGVDVSAVRATDSPTGTATILVDDEGANMIVLTRGANSRLDEHDVHEALAALDLRSVDVVVLSMEVDDASLIAASDAAVRVGARIVLNASPVRTVAAQIARARPLVVVNGAEAVGLAGGHLEPVAAARVLSKDFKSPVVVTVGAGGAICAQGNRVDHVAAQHVDVVDTTGAGDAFLGVLALALARGSDLADAARLGCVAGAYACGGIGARHHISAAQLTALT